MCLTRSLLLSPRSPISVSELEARARINWRFNVKSLVVASPDPAKGQHVLPDTDHADIASLR